MTVPPEQNDIPLHPRRLPPWTSRWVAIALGLGVFATLVWVLRFDRERIVACLGSLRWSVVALLPLCTSVTLIGRFLRWHFLLRRVDVRIKTRLSLAIYALALPMALTPAYVGELVKAELVHRSIGRGRGRVACVVVLERLLDFLALALIWVGASVGPALNRLEAGSILVLIVAGVGLALFVGKTDAHTAPGRVTRRLLAPRTLVVALLASVIFWIPPCVGLLLLAGETGLSIGPNEAARTFAGSTVLGAMTLSPAGVGVAGGLMVRDLIGLGLAAETAIAVIIVLRLTTTWLTAAIGGVALLAYARGWRWSQPGGDTAGHFEALSEAYDAEIPEHIRVVLLEKKTGLMLERLEPAGQTSSLPCRGLDIGCGRGWYAHALRGAGHTMVAMDVSFAQASATRRLLGADGGASVVVASGCRLPFSDASFDFACAINVVHHLPDCDAQRDLFVEVSRVLRGGGRFFLHEINVANPIFRLYMSYFFPIIRNIDEGDEHWLLPGKLMSTDTLELESIDYFTFFPDFLPRFLLDRIKPLNDRLATSRLRRCSAHYMATFRRRRHD